jgi:carboxylesterase type B
VRSAQAEDHTTVTHSSELTFVFSSVQDEAEYGSTSVEELSEPVRLADMVVAYFTNFAKTGDPNGVSDLGQSLPAWPQTRGRKTLAPGQSDLVLKVAGVREKRRLHFSSICLSRACLDKSSS